MYDTVLPLESGYSLEFLSHIKPEDKTSLMHPAIAQGLHVLEGRSSEEMYSLILSALQKTTGKALIIDCLSVTNPHHIVQLCRKTGLNYQEYLDRILIERPFTAYQMTSVIGEMLPRWIKDNNISVLVGVGLFSLLQDPDLNALHRKWGKRLVMRRLRIATQHFGLTTLLLPLEGKGHLYFQNNWHGK